MNVIGTRPDAWWKDRHAAMVNLVDLLERWAASSGAEVTVVSRSPLSADTLDGHRGHPRPRHAGTRPTMRSSAACSPTPSPARSRGHLRPVLSDRVMAAEPAPSLPLPFGR